MMRFAQWLHRWLGLILLLQVVLWLVSGLYFSLQGHHAMSGHQYKQNPTGLVLRQAMPNIGIEEIWRRYPEALSIQLYRIGDTPQYVVELADEDVYLHGHTGQLWHTNAKQAQQLALATYSGPGNILSTSPLTKTKELVGWQGQGYKILFADELNTRIYVDAANGQVLDHRNTPWLLADWAFKLHFMDYSGARSFNHLLIYTAALLALWFTLSGVLLLVQNLRRGDFNPRRQPTILESLQRQHKPIASGCGGGGTCGLCKVKLTEPTVATQAEQLLLTTIEINSGIRLACQHRDHGQTIILLDEHVTHFKLALVAKTKLSEAITKLTFKSEPSCEYSAGQFMQFKIPDGNNVLLRHYSFATKSLTTAPTDTPLLHFLIRHVPAVANVTPAGIGSSYLLGLQVGDTVDAAGPFGNFVATDTNREQVYIAGGVGIAPIHALVESESQRQRHLFHGARSEAELIFADEFKLMPTLDYHPVVDKFVHEEVAHWLNQNPGDYDFYVCGPPAMLAATLQLLADKKIPKSRIRYDDFGI
ncbi:NADH:quinone oxidoreductase [Pseudidiomarina tainanensis]|jgi:Na+-transporting NADH:ubiquinone oxidoreductase subunit NqrF|uniref:NADH:quinone oxidoreductase n=1 Tax=Pseudidiomarina tainanensis TaxID=502365 RepID=A0ACD2HGK4_9GAMM|nr:PepSY domain-containing protein [Pseudidiomarina tainanensis]RZQ55494.1 NADH:quinone oxidoreductase [Pseudidiomarina tainanensis]